MRFFVVTKTDLVGHLCLMDNGGVKGITPFCLFKARREQVVSEIVPGKFWRQYLNITELSALTCYPWQRFNR